MFHDLFSKHDSKGVPHSDTFLFQYRSSYRMKSACTMAVASSSRTLAIAELTDIVPLFFQSFSVFCRSM